MQLIYMFMLCTIFSLLSRKTFEIRGGGELTPPANFKHLETLPVIGLINHRCRYHIEIRSIHSSNHLKLKIELLQCSVLCLEFTDQMGLPDFPDEGVFAPDLFYWDEFENSVGGSGQPEMGSYRELCFCLADVGHSPNVTSTTPLSGFARLPHVLWVVLDALTVRFSAGDQVYHVLIMVQVILDLIGNSPDII